MKTISIILGTFALATAIGCGGSPGMVSKGDLQKVRQASEQVDIGMDREAVLKAYRKANTTRLSSASVNGVDIEEWKVEAFHDDDWDKSRDLFVRFLYFANGALVDSSDDRLDFRNKPELIERWTKE